MLTFPSLVIFWLGIFEVKSNFMIVNSSVRARLGYSHKWCGSKAIPWLVSLLTSSFVSFDPWKTTNSCMVVTPEPRKQAIFPGRKVKWQVVFLPRSVCQTERHQILPLCLLEHGTSTDRQTPLKFNIESYQCYAVTQPSNFRVKTQLCVQMSIWIRSFTHSNPGNDRGRKLVQFWPSLWSL